MRFGRLNCADMFGSAHMRVLQVAVSLIMSKNLIKWLCLVVSYFDGQVFATGQIYYYSVPFSACV